MPIFIFTVLFWYAPLYAFNGPVDSPDHYAWLKREAEKLAVTKDFRARYPVDLRLTPDLVENIGRKILNNEASCNIKDLIEWNKGEDFPSMGLAHTIWYPEGKILGYEESFPQMIHFFREYQSKHGSLNMPLWLDKPDIGRAPWHDRQEFIANEVAHDKKEELRAFLARPDMRLMQIRYMIDRLEKGLLKILADAELRGDAAGARRIYKNFRRVAETDYGVRALVDYVNFKGEGVAEGERTPLNQLHWGLKQVLLDMPEGAPNANVAFADSAYNMLKRTADNAKPEHQAMRYKWLAAGWTNRINTTYRSGVLDRVACSMFDNSPAPAGRATSHPQTTY